jgi:stress response protein SCP2
LQLFNSFIVHYGDNKTGVGEGDDEVLSVDFANVDPNAYAMAVIINSFKGIITMRTKNSTNSSSDKIFSYFIIYKEVSLYCLFSDKHIII